MAYCAVYLNRIYRERNCPEKPEDPLIMEKDIPYDSDFTFIDFVPSVLAYSSTNQGGVEYHRFSHLIDTANSWLHRNTQWKLVNCETVKLSYRHNMTSMVSRWEQQINPVAWNNQITREFETSLKVLRLWLRRKDIDEDDTALMNENGEFAMRVNYIDFIPQRLNGNVFESIDDVLVRVNARLQKADAAKWSPITIESLKVEANSDWCIDSEVSLVEESSRHLTILRLFYEEYNFMDAELWPQKNNKRSITIEIEDFKPRHLSGGSFFKRPQFEPFGSLVQRAAKWLTSQTTLHFMNAQSIEVRVKSLSKIDSRSSTHNENGDYIQMLRVILWKHSNAVSAKKSGTRASHPRPRSSNNLSHSANSNNDGSQQPPAVASTSLQLGTKVILATKYDHPLDSLQQRIYSWLRSYDKQDICILSAETVDIYGKDDDERNLERSLEDCFQSNRLGTLNMYAFTAIRLFYCILPEEETISISGRTVSLMSLPANTNSNSPPIARKTQVTFKLVRQSSATQQSTKSPTPPSQQQSTANNENVTSNVQQQPQQQQQQQQSGLRSKSPRLVHQMTIDSSTVNTAVISKDLLLAHRRPTEIGPSDIASQIRSRSRSSSCNLPSKLT